MTGCQLWRWRKSQEAERGEEQLRSSFLFDIFHKLFSLTNPSPVAVVDRISKPWCVHNSECQLDAAFFNQHFRLLHLKHNTPSLIPSSNLQQPASVYSQQIVDRPNNWKVVCQYKPMLCVCEPVGHGFIFSSHPHRHTAVEDSEKLICCRTDSTLDQYGGTGVTALISRWE